MATFSDYTSSGSAGSDTTGSSAEETKYWSLDRLKRSYQDYLTGKIHEVDEQKDSRRYRHASQWTAEQVKIFNKRKQPIVTYNRIGRKIDGVIGLVEKLRQSPKAYPRTPNEEQAADLATAVVRSVLDETEWKTKSYLVGQNAAIDGFAGVELLIEPGDEGDPTVSFEVVENDGFFYDPRSNRLDFSDARYMGMGKWLDVEQAKEMFPDKADGLEDYSESATDLSTDSDREKKWFITDGRTKRIRVVDCWYIMDGEWCWAIFTGNMKLQEGKSWLHDDKGKSQCKFIMFSAQVDQDGDRYGFVRNLKSAQDEINQRRSKALHLLNTRRIIAEQGAFDDLEVTRRESTRPDGIVIRNKGFEAEFDDGAKNQEIQAHLEFLVDAKSEIENFGPNPALVGQGSLGDKSGRAIQLLQQAGIAELGPFLLAFRGWKIRLYRGIWLAIKEHWKAERYIRVTDDQSVLQWVGINQVAIDPQTGMPAMQNHVAALDVDLVMDEGPDSLTIGIETYDALLAISQSGAQVPPDVLIELHPNLDPETKKRILEKLQKPDPMKQLQEQGAQAEIQKVMAEAELAKAKAMDTMRGDQGGPQEHPAVTMAEIENKQADTMHKKAQAMKTMQEAVIAPQQASHDMQMDREQNVNDRTKMAIDKQGKDMDRAQNAYESGADRDQAAYENERGRQHESGEADRGRQHETQSTRSDPKHELEREKLQLERERMQMEREEREKDRKAKSEDNENNNEMAREREGRPRRHLAETKQMAPAVELFGKAAAAMAQSVAKLAESTKSMADNSKSMAEATKEMTKAAKSKKRVVRDKAGRVSHVENID